ncbi:MAG: tyrosine-type recombinase/integrase [Sphingobium sp.]
MSRWRAADKLVDRLGPDGERLPVTTVIHHGGRPLAGKIRRGFEACVRDAGLAEEITPHWLRNTCATWLLEGGASLWDAAAYAGMTTKTLETCYGHHRPNHQSSAGKALGAQRK